MKFKTTQKAIKANYTNIICVGYCDLQHLLTYKTPIAYTVRREGWGADIYEATVIQLLLPDMPRLVTFVLIIMLFSDMNRMPNMFVTLIVIGSMRNL